MKTSILSLLVYSQNMAITSKRDSNDAIADVIEICVGGRFPVFKEAARF
jgi:hypothetical protein